MKRFILILILTVSSISLSQNNTYLTIKELQNTSVNTPLAKYLKSNVSKKLLKKLSYKGILKTVNLSFSINKENKPYNIKLNNYSNSAFYKATVNAFKNYPLEKLNLDSLETKSIYYLQIVSARRGKSQFETSTTVNRKTPPITNNCNDLLFYKDIETCLSNTIKEHGIKHINFAAIKRFNFNKTINIAIALEVDSTGKLNIKELKTPSLFKAEIVKVITDFPKFKSPATLNGNPTKWLHNISFKFNKSNLPKLNKTPLNYDSIHNTDENTNFASYLKKIISNKELNLANLSRLKTYISVYFEVDKTLTPFNITTNARSETLNSKIIKALKSYPIEKFKIGNNTSFKRFFTVVISLKNNVPVIKTNKTLGFEKYAVYPGCEKSKNIYENKKCLSRKIQTEFLQKFDFNLPKKLNLPKGRTRMLINFKIDKNGNITNVKLNAPHKLIEQEVIKVMQQLPQLTPAKQNNNTVAIKFRFPFSLVID